MSDLSALERETLAAIESAADESALEAARVAALGKKGSISALLATLGKLAPDERKVAGKALNAAKQALEGAFETRERAFASQALDQRLKHEWLDLTLPAPGPRPSAREPSGLSAERLSPLSSVWPRCAR